MGMFTSSLRSLACGLLMAVAAPAWCAEPAARPRVGLVLGGGGARGAAHIGVLEVLQELRVPVDCVAGTSMGALMAGAWASGLSPTQLGSAMAKADWADMFQDDPDYRDLDFRHKRLSQRFLPGSETGIQSGSVVTPPGVVLGQKIKLFFNHLVAAEKGEPSIEQLPLPLSIIATDIGTGERVVFRDGSLTLAMRASMAVPGLIAPVEDRGRKLVDGGLVDNLPIREVRERCGAEVVIAVDVGSPPLRPDEVSGLLSITAQMIALLTDQNVKASLATLGSGDIYIKPDLGDITAADFVRHVDAAARGRAAADAVRARLAGLGLDEPQYAAWQRSVKAGSRALPVIDEVEVTGLRRVDAALVQRHIGQRTGQTLDTDALSHDLMDIYGDGYYERVDYTVRSLDGRQRLTVLPIEKSWGPDYLRLGLQVEASLSQGATFQLRGGYHKTWINTLGGELLFTGELGNRTGVGVEWYQPLTAAHRWFIDVEAATQRERVDYFAFDERIALYRARRDRIDLTAGINLHQIGQLRAGFRKARVRNNLDTGVDIFSLFPEADHDGWLLGLEMDQLDRLYFARTGWAAKASWLAAPRSDYARLQVELRGARPVGDWVFGARTSWTGATRGQLPLSEAGRLGGFLALTAYSNGQFIGDDVAYGHVRAERIIGRLPLGLRGDMRLGAALEAGRVGTPYTLQQRQGVMPSLAIFLGGETPLGTAFVGIGRGLGGATNAYFFIGTP
ncbi:MAG: patatin-like phospholipase family protein [Burkholderiales bacterium]|nr:patatin-like phospholipase family protein [Burkholderiales bacterium]